MAIQVQLRRGTAAQNNAFTGAIGELSFDTTANQVRVHDGSTAGGFKIGVGDFPTGTNNIALGNTALDSLDGSSPGGNNTAVGHDALTANTTASFNTAIGVSSGSLITTGQKNTIVGSFDGNEGGLDIRTANNHIVLSDGDGNPRLIIDNNGNVDIGGETTELKLKNTTHEDTDGGRESKISFQGEQSGGEQSILAQIQASHQDTSDDQKGELIFRTNDGSDGTSPTTALVIDSAQNVGIGTSSPNTTLTLSDGTDEFDFGVTTNDLTIKTVTSDGSDDQRIILDAGNGGQSSARGAFIAISGNEASSNPGQAIYQMGNVSGASHVFRKAGGNDAVTIDSDGNCGIGTSSPSTILTLKRDSAGTSQADYPLLSIDNGNANGFSQLRFADDGSEVASIISHSADKYLIFRAGGSTERARLDSSGNFMVATTNTNIRSSNDDEGFIYRAGEALDISCHSDTVAIFNRMSSNGNCVSIRRGGIERGSISVTTSSTSFNTSSDYRLKENVTDISDGITRVKQLAPKRFNFIADADTTVDGFLAHEAQTVVPEAVTGTKDALEVWTEKEKEKNKLPKGVSVGDNKLDDDGNTIPEYQGIDQAKLVPLLTAALQEAIAKIETLETKVAALEE